MESTVNEYVDELLSEEAHKHSCDSGKLEDIDLKIHLPEWFDEEKYNQGRRFFWDFSFSFGMNMILALMAAFAVPSIMKILVGTRRANSPITSYKRYVSTLMHVISWHEYELKPGTKAWRSLQTARSRHLRASKDAMLKGRGVVSQRDLALTQIMLMGFAFLKPDKFSIRQIRKGDWEGYVHFWRTIGYMLGLEDRYNGCQWNVEETREVVRILLERVFTPCLENVPEYFEHSAHLMLKSLGLLNESLEPGSILFMTRYYAEVPGYVYTETDRIAFQNKLRKHLRGKSEDIGVDTAELMSKSAVDGLPNRPPRLLYVRDFDTIETTPAYRRLNFTGRYRLAVLNFMMAIYNTDVGRLILNLLYRWTLIISFYFPYKAFMRIGLRESFVNMFVEDPKDDTEPKPNSEYEKPPPPDPWYGKLLTVLW